MASTAKVGPQDMPPKGGYGSIQIERIPLKNIFGVRSSLAAFLTCTFGGFYLYYLNMKMVKRNEIEMRSARFALMPMLLAERDRAVLKHLRKIREEEKDLMKDVEDWEVGTYYGEEVFKSLPKDTFIEPNFNEYILHSGFEAGEERYVRRFVT